jgi:Phosphotransferase enzyme family
MRSLIPALYNPSLDVAGFPLSPGDFHTQNIMVTDVESNPRITAVLDWELSSTLPTSSFAQYPLFIANHPAWKDDNPLCARNIRDQSAFNKFMQEAELKRDPEAVKCFLRHSRIVVAFIYSNNVFVTPCHIPMTSSLRTFSETTRRRNFLWIITGH